MNESSTSPPPAARPADPAPPNQAVILLRGGAGAIFGAYLGYLAFWWLASQGFYGMMIIGAAAGLLSGLAARGKSTTLGILCVIIALAASIFAEWKVFPFIKDKSLQFFLTHLHQVMPVHLLMIGLGAAAAYWFGQGR